MQIEVQMYLHILMIVGVIMSTPYIFKVFALFGKIIALKLYPTTVVELEFEDLDGFPQTKRIKLADTDELVKTLLRAKESR